MAIHTGKAYSGFAVPDLEAAATFYRDVLGFAISDEHVEHVLSIEIGSATVLVYPKPDHEPATYTILNIPVDDIEEAVAQLTERGVTFETYDGEMSTDASGIYRGVQQGSGPNIAWFRDPAGNILSVIEE